VSKPTDAAAAADAHHRMWSHRAQFIAAFAGLERSVDLSLIMLLDIARPNDAFLKIVLGRLTSGVKIDMLADAIEAKGLRKSSSL
jgi:hypothetical protein